MPTEELKESAEQYLMGTYARQPISIVRGRGTKVYDLEGREYVDFVGGIAVNFSAMDIPTWCWRFKSRRHNSFTRQISTTRSRR